MSNSQDFPAAVSMEQAAAPAIAAAPTSVTLFIGQAEKGPTTPTDVVSFADFTKAYGAKPSMLGASVRAYFANGGVRSVILRLPGASDADFLAELESACAVGGAADAAVFNLLCAPGLFRPAGVAACESLCRRKRAFLILDAPRGASPATIAREAREFTGPDARDAALYYPWIDTPGGLVPPCGFVAGVYARFDAARGVWKAPAGVDATVLGAVGLEVDLTDRDSDALNPLGVNCIRRFPQAGVVVFGARTLSAQSVEWKFVPVRRLALFIEASLAQSLHWTVFEPNDAPLWTRIKQVVEDFLFGLFRQGAFMGGTPSEAFFVRTGRETTLQSEIDAGILDVEIGFAPLRPAEFVVLRVKARAGAST